MTTLTSQYIVFELGLATDLTRLGAQVIAGVGFIGAGTVMVIKRREIKGITTAAGIWTAAIVGLCCGAGFYEGAVLATLFVLLAEIVFYKLEGFLLVNRTVFSIYVEYSESKRLGDIVDTVKKSGASVLSLEVKNSSAEQDHPCAVFTVRPARKHSFEELAESVKKISGVVSVYKM